MATTTPASSRLRRLARASAEGADGAPPRPEREHCELCHEPLEAEHRHLLEMRERRLLCVCRACRILFERPAAGGGHLRLLPQRRRRLESFVLDDLGWAALGIPVDLAFFFYSSAAARTVAFYPSPAGATESALVLEAWEAVAGANPELRELEPDVEALLVNRARGAREHWLVPVDDCYRLVALVRTRWRGFTGGTEVWEEISEFFDRLEERT
jgi:hypothetical protein